MCTEKGEKIEIMKEHKNCIKGMGQLACKTNFAVVYAIYLT